jgi:fido (protein-threonine AMPylation protein)
LYPLSVALVVAFKEVRCPDVSRWSSCIPFPNDNGRSSRLAADVLIVQRGSAHFTWSRANLQAAGDLRGAYIDALHAADDHDLGPLITFARS